MGSRHPVTISRSAAEALARLGRHLLDTSGEIEWGSSPVAEIEAALTDAASAAAWEPLRADVIALWHRDRELSMRGRANVDQLAAQMRETFADAGVSIDDPAVVRAILLTLKSVTRFAAHAHALGGLDHHQFQGAKDTTSPVALAASRFVDPADLA